MVEKLVEKGMQVVVLARSEEAVAELNGMDGVTAIMGDAFDPKPVVNAMEGLDAAGTTLAVTTTERYM